ncbi:MAG: MogA/MoaB family molybdenum cofactor biosynthesis protein [Candidatus Methanomethylicia archaeon]|nr:MogA/MoaB family molybdenum cofactor biosynthesis protein [Candidatus Methanomethylicia archaeon]
MSIKHKEEALKEVHEVKIAIIVVSTSRYTMMMRGEKFDDESGEEAMKTIEKYGFKISCKEIVPDYKKDIQKKINERISSNDDVIILIGGTGLSKTDVTYEAVEEIIEKKIDGFGEIFRILSYREIGSAAIISRAIAGISNGRIIVAIPGSKNAIPIALEKLLLPELPHILFHARRD